MTCAKGKLSAREALAQADFLGYEDVNPTGMVWSNAGRSIRMAWRRQATRSIRNLRRLGFSVVPTPTRPSKRKAGRNG